MGHALWLGLSLMWAAVSPSVGQAQPLAPAYLDARAAALSLAQQPPPKLEVAQHWLVAATQVALTPPCLGCKTGLRTATQDYAPEQPSPPVPAAQPAPRPVKKPQYALGDSWNLGGKRVLSVRLTPSPEECAPLVRLSF